MDILVVRASDGEVLPGIPTPRLIENGGGEAYFVRADEDSKSGIPGVWYLHVPGRYESLSGEYTRVRIQTK